MRNLDLISKGSLRMFPWGNSVWAKIWRTVVYRGLQRGWGMWVGLWWEVCYRWKNVMWEWPKTGVGSNWEKGGRCVESRGRGIKWYKMRSMSSGWGQGKAVSLSSLLLVLASLKHIHICSLILFHFTHVL